MKTILLASLLICGTALAASPSSINNDDSCDIKVGPAATLLLPYFDVDPNPIMPGQTTLFTITNVTRYPQIAHVTLWTDLAYPVLTFNVFLTGYDVQAVNLYDVIIRGTIAPPSGTTSSTTPGALSTSTNPNLRSPLDCGSTQSTLPATLTNAVKSALTTGVFNPGGGVAACSTTGGVHAHAIGYATIDVVASCTDRMPLDPLYYSTDLLFDNVLIGDYQQIGVVPAGTGTGTAIAFDAAGNPMVHVRAVPEGGGAGSNVPTALPYTFYDRYTPAVARTIDRRQPLPSTFAARFIQGGTSEFATNLKIWREGTVGAGASCAATANNNQWISISELTRFDEHENPYTFCTYFFCEPPGLVPALAATSSTNTVDSTYPYMAGTDVGGWMYLNLNDGGSTSYSVTNHASGIASSAPTVFGNPRASQNWVTVTMFGKSSGSRMTAELDAAPLANGCTPSITPAGIGPYPPIGPAGGVFVCPPGTTLTNGTTTFCSGTNVNPNP